MKNFNMYYILLSTVCMIAFSNNQSLADNTYRYFYLYRNSDAYQDYHQEEDSTSTDDQEGEKDSWLYEEERDYYVEGDEEYADEESYEDEPGESTSNDTSNYQD